MQTISGKPLSRFSFGTMQFGGKADEAESAAMYAACRDAGVNFFDTANGYTGGQSEQMLGRFAASERDDVFIATKCASDRTASPEVIEREFDESRRRLGQETVDLLYIHQPDPTTPVEVTFGALAKYVRSGAVRNVGISNFSAWASMKARQAAREAGIDVTFLQPMYNLVKRQAEVEILPMAVSEEFYVCPYSPLGGGLLTGKYAAGEGGRLRDDSMYSNRYGPDWMHKAAGDLRSMASDLGVHPATLAVAWVARHQGVWGPITSARSVEQLAPSLAAITFDMDDDLYARMSALTPTPPPANDRLEEA